MKTVKINLLMFALVLFANISMASGTGDINVNIRPLEEERALVAINNESGFDYEISVKDENGHELCFDEADASESKYRKVYDFSDLADGDYKLLVTVNKSITERDFSITNNSIDVKEFAVNPGAQFSFNDNVLRVAYLNKSESKVNFKIYKDGELVYKKGLGKNFGINEAISLSRFESGNYRAVITSDKLTFGCDLVVE